MEIKDLYVLKNDFTIAASKGCEFTSKEIEDFIEWLNKHKDKKIVFSVTHCQNQFRASFKPEWIAGDKDYTAWYIMPPDQEFDQKTEDGKSVSSYQSVTQSP